MIDMNNQMIHVQFSNSLNSRKEMLNGESYIVYPVIMMTEGVHAGSDGPTFYSAEELTNYYWTWNGVPVSVNHPIDDDGSPISCNDPQVYNTQVVGKIFNTVFEDNKLKAEAWLRESVLNALGSDVVTSLNSGTNLEVSTGLFSDIQEISGNWMGEEYNTIATNIRPDHLALLPGGTGACSWKDGCGIRANKGGEMKKEPLKYFQLNEDITAFTILEQMDYTQLVELASGLIDSLDDSMYYHYMRKLYPDFVVYSVRTRNGSDLKYYKRNYSVQEGKLSFDGDPVEVVIKEIIETVANNQSNQSNQSNQNTQNKENKGEGMSKTMEECCPKQVDELISNNENFTEEDRDVLLAMTEASFEMVINKAKPIEKKAETDKEENKPEVNEEENKPEVNEEKEKMTFDELLANADPEVAESIRNGHKMFQDKKNDLVQKILAHEANAFKEDELKGFAFDQLEKIASFIPEKKGSNYIGNAGSYPGAVIDNEDSSEGTLPDMDFDFTEK